MSDIRVETVKTLNLQPGDILHVTVGGDVGDETWIPALDDLLMVRDIWEAVVPEGIPVIVSHHLVEPTILQTKVMVGKWPPKVKP